MKYLVSIYEAKTQLSTLLRDVEGGAVITITRHGKPVAELRKPLTKNKAQRGCLKSTNFYMAEDFDAPLAEFAEYMPDFDTGPLRVAEDPPAPRGKARKKT